MSRGKYLAREGPGSRLGTCRSTAVHVQVFFFFFFFFFGRPKLHAYSGISFFCSKLCLKKLSTSATVVQSTSNFA